MIPDADYAYEALLRFNYLPMVKEHRDEIPPVFSSEEFTPAIANAMVAAGTGRKQGDGFDQIEYRATRFNNVIRKLDIPHPMPYAMLCQVIRDNWSNLQYICTNDVSRIKPEDHGERLIVMDEYENASVEEFVGRLVVMEKSQFPSDLLRHLDLATGAKYWVEADIANCFPSIYSHAIPWALAGHAVAKVNRGAAHWYNQLDIKQRFMKRAETQGVPIGPATSNVIAEIVLAKVDAEMIAKGYKFIRFIDDYNCFTNSRDEAEKFIRDLERELDKFLLRLNAKKVAIRSLPLPQKQPWVNELTIALNSNPKYGPSQIANLLDYALHLQNGNPDGSVVKYAARMLVKHLSVTNAAVYVKYLLHLATYHPIVLPLICEALTLFIVPCDVRVLRNILEEHLEYRRSDGVCWTIYLACLAGEKIGVVHVAKVILSEDCMAMACLCAIDEGVAEVDQFLNDLIARAPTDHELDKYWLLIYERAKASSTVQAKFKTYLDDTKLSVLITQGVSFLKTPAISSMTRATAII